MQYWTFINCLKRLQHYWIIYICNKMYYTTNWYSNTCRWCAHQVTETYREEYRYPRTEIERIEELFYTSTMRTDKMSVNWRKREIRKLMAVRAHCQIFSQIQGKRINLQHMFASYPASYMLLPLTWNMRRISNSFTHIWQGKSSVVSCMSRQTWGISWSDTLDIDWSSCVKVDIIIL